MAPQREVVLGFAIDPELVGDWLVRFLRDEMLVRRGFERAVIGLSGGVDSSILLALLSRYKD